MSDLNALEITTAHTVLMSRLILSLDHPTQVRLREELGHAIAELRHDPQAPQAPGVSNKKVADALELFARKLDHF